MNRHELSGWHFVSSHDMPCFGEKISTLQCPMDALLPITVPGTVVNGLVENKKYPDPFVGTQMAAFAGFKAGSTTIFSQIPKPDNSPFRRSWWYRTEFNSTHTKEGTHTWLHLGGINYCANVWLNGKRIAGSDFVRGTFRLFDIDITRFLSADGINVLGIEVFAPEPDDLGLTFIDWSVVPPDDCMGITQPVYWYQTGPVAMRNLFVKSEFPAKAKTLAPAKLTVVLDLENLEAAPCEADLCGNIGGIGIRQRISLSSYEKRQVVFSPRKFPKLVVKKPRLWWPHTMGAPELYHASMKCSVGKDVSEIQNIQFGIRSITSRINKHGARVFAVNGKEILIRGAGWAPDMLFRQSIERDRIDVAYIKNMHLNTVRFEGMIGSDFFLEECDREGVLVMAGWPCCNHWEKWEDWKPGDLDVACASLRSQVTRLRAHASLAAFLYGSDKAPPVYAEKKYVAILDELCPELVRLASAAATPTKYGGTTGVKMSGPYAYVPPSYWYDQKFRGAANLFNTETGPGMSIPPYESLAKMLPDSERFVGSPTWNFHCGLGPFSQTTIDNALIDKRYGAPKSLEDYAKCAQVAGYEAWRAMFEAHQRNFPLSTGVVAWMLNSSWPSLVWQLYDYYLAPLGGFFGVQKACQPLHALFSYDDRSVWLCNSSPRDHRTLSVSAEVYTLESRKVFEKKVTVPLSPYSSVRAFVIPEIEGLSDVYFLRCAISRGKTVLATNFYWLSAVPDIFAENGPWYHVPLRTSADMSKLRDLPKAEINVQSKFKGQGKTTIVEAEIENNSKAIAFFLRAKIFDTSCNDFMAPVFWEENCISLLPGEKSVIRGTFAFQERATCRLHIEGWNCSFE